ncbi:methyl-accepting chemotaxis protein, partial [Methylobacterium gossipiicola]
MRFTIKTKLVAGFGAVLALTAIAGGLGYQKLRASDEAMNFIVGRFEVQALALDAKAQTIRSISNTRAAVLGTDDAAKADFSKRAADNRADALATMAKAKGYINSEEGKRLFDDISEKYEKQRVLATKVLEMTRINTGARAWEEINGSGRPTMVALRAEIGSILGRSDLQTFPDLIRNAVAVQSYSDEAWGELQAAVGASNLRILEQRVAESRRTRDEAAHALNALIGAMNAAGIGSDGMRQKFEAWSNAFGKVLTVIEDAGSLRAVELAGGEYAVLSTATARAFDAFIDFQNRRMVQTVTQARATSSEGQSILLATVAAALLLGLAIATWLALSISRGLARTVALADAVAMGDLSKTEAVTSQDEIGDLVTAMNRMTANLTATAHLAGEIASGNLAVEAKVQSDKDTMGLALQAMLVNLRATAGLAGEIARGNLAVEATVRSDKDTMGLALQAMLVNLRATAELAGEIANGNLDLEATVQSDKDTMGLALQAMLVNLRATADLAGEIARGNLTVDATVQSDKDAMGLALQTMLTKLRGVVTEALMAAGNVSSGSQELSASAEQLSQGSTEQASSTEEASASMEEMAANVKQNAENA